MVEPAPLVAADETFTHQIPQTFASVSQSDPSWTEKVWATAHARDGSLQVTFGLGKYTNRGVYDSAGGVARGTTQWTVRGSRRLSAYPDHASVGPLHYEVVEPLRRVRCRLEPNEHADISFDVTWIGEFEPALEVPYPDRSPDGYRVTQDCQRYHQVGTAEGWVELEGVRTEISPDEWFSVRDHSWGIRPGVGLPIPGLPRGARPSRMLMSWFPMRMQRDDGTPYSLFSFFQHEAGDHGSQTRTQAEEQRADGTTHRFADVRMDMRFRDDNRRVIEGTITLVDHDGRERPLHVRPVGDTGFHLGTAGYFGWRGHLLGNWMGDLVVDGERVQHCDSPDVARELHQLRDLLVHVDDPVGGGEGFGNLETMAIGAFAELGLTAEGSFL